MTTLRLPPPEPPEDQAAAELREVVEFCRHHLADARWKFARAQAYADERSSTTESIHTAVLIAVRGREVELWAEQLDTWTRRLAQHARQGAGR